MGHTDAACVAIAFAFYVKAKKKKHLNVRHFSF
jgi:hypothetical protein